MLWVFDSSSVSKSSLPEENYCASHTPTADKMFPRSSNDLPPGSSHERHQRRGLVQPAPFRHQKSHQPSFDPPAPFTPPRLIMSPDHVSFTKIPSIIATLSSTSATGNLHSPRTHFQHNSKYVPYAWRQCSVPDKHGK